MKKVTFFIAAFLAVQINSYACDKCKAFEQSDDFKIKSASVIHNKAFGTLEFEITVVGKAGATKPTPIGKLDMAPVLAYVFPTTLKAEDIGFGKTEGIVALALTSHPDFDDSPLWDENADGKFDNDGIVWHPHWVVLVEDKRVKGGLAVKEYKPADKITKPTTAPDMPMYMDSPGFPVVTAGNKIRVSVPAYRIKNKVQFNYDAVTCYLEVSAPEGGMSMDKPMLGVYNVFSILSKKLTLPYTVK
ncbi:hypothetical protein [Elizabethkingia meningoseptica]|uniref:hypothetical protein n=1 Tax=Elizabethkingia meningoseptica TaxID=238 RepID=UPI0023AEDDB8|nr:hypothetical protein [Elizabethkingia meningoseptica]MDE5492544.1 hypothetical protein [Elizabethkingia meningoseptica]